MFRSRRAKKKSGVEYWDWIKLEPGKSWKGWSAGPLVGVEVHHFDGSKACRADLSNGALPCQLCKAGMPTIFRGYVPLWDEGAIRHFSMVGQRYEKLALEIKLHQPVKVTKLVSRGCPIRIEYSHWSSLQPRLDASDAKPQDLKSWLLRIWGDEELEEWIRSHPDDERSTIAGDKAVSTAKTNPPEDAPDIVVTKANLGAHVLRRSLGLKDKDEPVTVGEVLAKMNGRAKDAR